MVLHSAILPISRYGRPLYQQVPAPLFAKVTFAKNPFTVGAPEEIKGFTIATMSLYQRITRLIRDSLFGKFAVREL
jgi:hypothetical protein